jgi:heme A synthase
VNPSKAGLLDSIGRQFLSTIDYRVYGLLALLALLLFCVWRRWRYRSWPSYQDCIVVVLSLGAMIGGITVLVVFLLTKPPAIDVLSSQTLALIGLLLPIVIFGNAFPKLLAQLFPPQAPKPPQN